MVRRISMGTIAAVIAAGVLACPSTYAANKALFGVKPYVTAIEPCTFNCGGSSDKKFVSIAYRDKRGPHTARFLTAMQTVDSVILNSSAHLVVKGTSGNGRIDVVALVVPNDRYPLLQWMTLNSSISPDGRFVAFSQFNGQHLYDGAYSDTMVYVFDTTIKRSAVKGLIILPDGAEAIYPKELIEKGSDAILTEPVEGLGHVISEFKWKSNTDFSFVVGEPNVGDSITSVSVELSRQARPTYVEQELPCDRIGIKSWEYDKIVSNCTRR